MKQILDIGEVSQASGLAPSAIRFYEEKGLIQSVGRKGLRRLFLSSVLDRLAVIVLARLTGFSLGEITAMMPPKGIRIDRQLLLAKADQLDNQIKTMTAMRNGLRHAAACTAPSHFECPKFLRLLHISNKRLPKRANRKGA